MYDQEANAPTAKAATRSERQTNAMGNFNGQRNPVHLRLGYGNRLYAWSVGKRSGQCRDLQDDFTRFFYSYRRHDWVPIWYQTYAK